MALVLALALLSPTAAAQSGSGPYKAIFDDLETGFRAHREGEYAKAVEFYTKVIRNPDLRARDRAVAYLLRGEVQMDAGNLKDALLDFTRALKIKPNYAQAYYFRSLVLEKQDQLEEAYKEIQKAIAQAPEDERFKKKQEELAVELKNKGKPIPEQ